MSTISASTTSTTAYKVTADTTGALVLQTGATPTTAVTVDTGQRTTFPTTIAIGNATPSTSGSGITFPATQSASSDVNTLDDYEEGTWSPSVAGTATYNQQLGWYVKVGQLVTISFDMGINVIGTGSGTTISGLPFANVQSNAQNPGGGVSYFSGLAVSVFYLATQISGTNIIFITTTAATATCNNTASIFTSSARVIGTLSYRTAT